MISRFRRLNLSFFVCLIRKKVEVEFFDVLCVVYRFLSTIRIATMAKTMAMTTAAKIP